MCLYDASISLMCSLYYKLQDTGSMPCIVLSPEYSEGLGALAAVQRPQLPLTFVMGASMVMEWIRAMDG